MKNGLFVQEDAFNLDVGQQDEMRRVFLYIVLGFIVTTTTVFFVS